MSGCKKKCVLFNVCSVLVMLQLETITFLVYLMEKWKTTIQMVPNSFTICFQ